MNHGKIIKTLLVVVLLPLYCWAAPDDGTNASPTKRYRLPDFQAPVPGPVPVQEFARPVGLSLKVDLLYWKTESEALDYAETEVAITPIGSMSGNQFFDDLDVKHAHFPWEPGVRAQLGYDWSRVWSTHFAWTYYQSHAERSLSQEIFNPSGFFGPDSLNINQIWVIGNEPSSLTPISELHARFRLQLNYFDWDLGKRVAITNPLSFRPFLGIRGASLIQKLVVSAGTFDVNPTEIFFPGEEVSSKRSFRNQFLGLGMFLGSDANLDIFPFFSLFGSMKYTALAGRFNFKENETILIAGTPSTTFPVANNNSWHRYTAKSMLEMRFGTHFGWEYGCTNHFDLNIGYEFQIWFQQLQLQRFYPFGINTFGVPQVGDVSFHGLLVEGSFSF